MSQKESTIVLRQSCTESAQITNELFTNDFKMEQHNEIMNETERTIVALLWHENVIDHFKNNSKYVYIRMCLTLTLEFPMGDPPNSCNVSALSQTSSGNTNESPMSIPLYPSLYKRMVNPEILPAFLALTVHKSHKK